MKITRNSILWMFIGLSLVLMPASAQNEGGGTIVFGQGGDPENMQVTGSPYYCTSSDCWTVAGATTIGIIGTDPEIGWYAPNQHRALAEGWEFSNNNRILTIHLRDDLFWSDGTPVTAADVLISYEIGLRPESNSGGEVGVNIMQSIYENIEAPDEHTVVITFNTGTCDALGTIQLSLSVLPEHIYRQLIDEVGYEGLRTHEWQHMPDVVSGPFIFEDIGADGIVRLRRNESYADTPLGYVSPEKFVQVLVLDNDERIDRFWSGEINLLADVPIERRTEFIDAAAEGLIQVYEYPLDRWWFMAMNQADPTDPQAAVDEDGNHIEQGLHPIFGDKLTRQAIAHAIDVDSIIDEALFGFGTRIPAHVVPGSWSYNFNLQPIPYEKDVSLSMLADAGWLLENPILPASENNRLICQDCLYAREVDAAFNGSYLEFDLLATDSYVRMTTANLIQSQLAEIGITVHVEISDSQMLFSQSFGQTFDAVLLGWGGPYPHNPQSTGLFGPYQDNPEDGGLNLSSFYNEAYFALEETAKTVLGCGLTERAEIYKQMQAIIQDEMPFVFLWADTGMYAASNEIEGFDPYPNDLWWNIESWIVHED